MYWALFKIAHVNTFITSPLPGNGIHVGLSPSNAEKEGK